MNLDGCSSSQGWKLYCDEIDDGSGDGDIVYERGLTVYDRAPGVLVPGDTDCPSNPGTGTLNPDTRTASFGFEISCEVEVWPDRFAPGLSLTLPGGATYTWDEYFALFHGIIPVGTYVSVQGTFEEAAWNLYVAGRRTVSGQDPFGAWIDFAIVHTREGIPLGIMARDGEVLGVEVIYRPN